MREQPWSSTEATTALEARIPNGGFIKAVEGGDCTVLAVTGRDEDVLVTFRWKGYPFTLGLGIPQTIPDAMGEGGDSPGAWADDAWTWLQEELGTGVVARASRADRGDYIELVEPDSPIDERFYLSSVSSEDDVAWEAIDYSEADRFDTVALWAARADGTLLSWVRAYLNNKSGSPYVGHAAVVAIDPATAHLPFCDVAPAVPRTVFVDLCLQAAHAASWQGARRVRTELNQPALDTLGFRQVADARELTTDFLDVDHDAYRTLLTESRQWRRPRSMRRQHSPFSIG